MNWRDAFPVQEVGKDKGLVWVLYARYKEPDKDSDPSLVISIEKVEVELTLTEDELITQLNETVTKFTHTSRGTHYYEILRADNDVAKRSRRGKANTEWNGARYYKGIEPKVVEGEPSPIAYAYDGPLVVGEHNGKFAIVLNPKFDDYGYVIQ